ncbi:MAG: serpin family protein [Proteobacteria bacterium]|nr:serpin family protein [Pseudomonadota bacterium]
MKTSHLALALLLALCTAPVIGCSSDEDNNTNTNVPSDKPGELTRSVKSDKARVDSKISDADLKVFVKGQYDLNYDILRKSGDDIAKKNAMISTYSIQTALAMVWAGADGETASEMQKALNFGDHAHEALNKLDKTIMALNREAHDDEMYYSDPIEIKTSNNLYLAPDYKWASEWLDALAINYGAGITEMNFAADPEKAREYINQVVSNDTHERIQDLIPEDGINAQTKSVITNAIYFKAPWSGEVSKKNDKLDFSKFDGSKIQVDALGDSGHFPYIKDVDYQAVVMSLREDLFEVMFILPDEGKFDSVMASMNGEIVLGIFDSLTRDTKIYLTFPTYEFTTELSLSDTLKSLGMVKAFSAAADFSKMTETPNELLISDVRHKSFIGVDEKGIEAAAATAVMVQPGSAEMPEEPIDLILDRPFMFIIYETQTHTPLFVGHVMDPSAK